MYSLRWKRESLRLFPVLFGYRWRRRTRGVRAATELDALSRVLCSLPPFVMPVRWWTVWMLPRKGRKVLLQFCVLLLRSRWKYPNFAGFNSYTQAVSGSFSSQLCLFVCWLIEADSVSSYENSEHTSSIGWSRSIDEKTDRRGIRRVRARNNNKLVVIVVDSWWRRRLKNGKLVQGESVLNTMDWNQMQSRPGRA